ncbi:MAG: YceI family protein [bacterium]|nr:YceI family protein [bacterium]
MIRFALIATLLVLSSSSIAENTDFSLQTTGAKQVVQFVSDAPLERIVGRADGISGKISLNLSNLTDGAAGTVTVDLKTLDTGLSLRNQHMRENHLHTAEHPDAVFTVTSIASADPSDISGGGVAATLVRGQLDLHGVKQEYEILGSLSFDKTDGTLRAQYIWPVQLKDHQIPRPAFLFMKLSDTQEITIDLQFH